MNPERKRRSIRRCIKIDKLSRRRLHVDDLNMIIRILYPYRQTINKYQKLLTHTNFTTSQKELIITTAHSLTIINELHRDQDSFGRFYVTREDMSNAIYMLQNELHLPKQEYLLSPNLRRFYKELQRYFFQKEFTNKDVRSRLGRSDGVNRHKLTELVDRGFLEIVDRTRKGFTYRLVNTK